MQPRPSEHSTTPGQLEPPAGHELLPVQSTSHEHDWSQSTPLSQVSLPVQATSQLPVPQVISPVHDWEPTHPTVHDWLVLHVIAPSHASPWQLTRQVEPVHSTAPVHD